APLQIDYHRAPFIARAPRYFCGVPTPWAARGREPMAQTPLLRYQGASPQVQEVEKLAQPQLLVADQMPRFGQHAFHHDLGFIPVPIQAGVHEILAGSRAGTMSGDDLGDDRRQVVDDLHANLLEYGSAGPQ